MTQRARRWQHRLIEATPALAILAVVLYGWGLLVILISDDDEACAKGLFNDADLVRMDEGYLPLRSTCVFEDGTIYRELPIWVNPLFFICAIGAVAGVAARVALARRRAEERRQNES